MHKNAIDAEANTTQCQPRTTTTINQSINQSITQGQVPVAAHTTTQAAVVDLLSILNDANVPDYLFESIMKWTRKYHDAGFDFCPPQKNHQGNLKWITEHLDCNHGIQPRITTVQLPGAPGTLLDCVMYDFVGQLMSLLNNPTLMKWGNLQLNKAGPLSIHLLSDTMIANTHTRVVCTVPSIVNALVHHMPTNSCVQSSSTLTRHTLTQMDGSV